MNITTRKKVNFSVSLKWLLLAGAALALGACSALNTPPAAQPAAQLSPQQIAAIIDSPQRSAADRANDLRRKPQPMLAFIGVRPGMVALDLSAGGGYTTELLARAVGPTGRVYGQSAPPRAPDSPVRPAVTPEGNSNPIAATAAPVATPAPRRTSAQALAERAKNPAAANIVAVVQPFEDPCLLYTSDAADE